MKNKKKQKQKQKNNCLQSFLKKSKTSKMNWYVYQKSLLQRLNKVQKRTVRRSKLLESQRKIACLNYKTIVFMEKVTTSS